MNQQFYRPPNAGRIHLAWTNPRPPNRDRLGLLAIAAGAAIVASALLSFAQRD